MRKLPIIQGARHQIRPLARHVGPAVVAGEARDRPDGASAATPSVLIVQQTYGLDRDAETAPDRLAAQGFRVVIAPSFTRAAYGVCVAHGLAPVLVEQGVMAAIASWAKVDPEAVVTVDLQSGMVEYGDRVRIDFVLDTRSRRKLVFGLDELDEMLQHRDDAQTFRSEYQRRMPWLSSPSQGDVEPGSRG